jgi:K+-sensing histidine kinase KdpD
MSGHRSAIVSWAGRLPGRRIPVHRVGELIASNALAASTVTDSRSGRAWLVRIVDPEILGYGAIAVDLGDARGENADITARRVEKLLEEATLTLKHLKAKEAIEQTTLSYQTEVLRDALVGGVSHELRTRLARSDAALRRHLRSTIGSRSCGRDCYRSIWHRAWSR